MHLPSTHNFSLYQTDATCKSLLAYPIYCALSTTVYSVPACLYDVMMSAEILPDIDVHDLVILSQVCCLDAAHGQDTSTVDQDIQPAEVSDSLLHCLLHRLLVSEVSRNKQRLNTFSDPLCPHRFQKTIQTILTKD